jgi:DNA-binding transcriptional regulator YiaG
MPNIASVLREEIIRLTRKEFRHQMEPLRKQLLAQRKTITSLRSDIDKLQRGIKALAKGARKNGQVEGDPAAPTTRARFSASGLRKLREKFELSREAFAPLLGVSAQTIYSWEQGGSRPRPEVIEKIAILRGLSKRQVLAVLEQHTPKAPKRTSPAAKKASKKVAKKPGTRAKASSKSATTAAAATAG